MAKTIDLRSDTVTQPTQEMRSIIANAKVGDDMYREDPSVIELEEYSAKITGKEAALFTSSGTMGNLLAMLVSVKRGEEVIMDVGAHIFHYELSGISAIVGAKPVVIPTQRGIFDAAELKKVHHPCRSYIEERTGLITIENTHNFAGGTVWQEAELGSVAGFAKDHNLPIHIDGARVFNASIASKLSVEKISSYAQTITFCLSKGLGAPIGAMLCGPKVLMDEARRWRKMIGGGMRQAGIVAAAGLYALKNNVARLAEDHQHAQLLAQAARANSTVFKDVKDPETNLLFLTTQPVAAQVAQKLESAGVRCLATAEHTIRFVTHLDVSKEDIDHACKVIEGLS